MNSVPRHADAGEYHAATGLEALFGWLYLNGDGDRIEKLFVDIGVSGREEAEKLVKIGDCCTYFGPYEHLAGDRICSRALDDRLGCYQLIESLKENPGNLPNDIYYCFVVQEEVGLRGAGVAADRIRPEYAIILETTTAADVAGAKGAEAVCRLGNGAVVPFMDRATVYAPELFRTTFAAAKANGIAVQTKTRVAGGNDAGEIHKHGCGVRVLNVSLPCRYLHAGSTVADRRDMDACIALLNVMLARFADA